MLRPRSGKSDRKFSLTALYLHPSTIPPPE
jgi:hypothetical protein